MSEEVAGYLQQFPEEMIFDTRNLDLLDSVGQGKKCYDILDFIITCKTACSPVDGATHW